MLHAFRLLLARIYFREIRIYGQEHLPTDGMTLFVSNHRNGAIDGYVLLKVLPVCRAIVGRNLTGSWFLRLFFGGQIEVYRKAENAEQKAWNRERLQEAALAMRRGQPVLIFPEGTSELGPHLLPVKKGAAFICHTLLQEAGDAETLSIVPLGLHYEEGWRFRSAAEIHIGPPVHVTRESTRNLAALTETMRQSLADVSENFADEEEQRQGESFASMLRYHGVCRKSHLSFCRMWARGNISEKHRERFLHFYHDEGLQRYQNTPLTAQGGARKFAIMYYLLLPLFLLAYVLNFLPLFGAYIAARKMADDTNVIALWRILVGTPLFVIQCFLYIIVGLFFCPLSVLAWLLVMYIFVTGTGICLLDVWRRAGVRGRNGTNAKHHEILSFCKEFK
ncbi:1-acyl-sn-glycerol-3-phosphate acyltransferase [Aneurinibacillus aneurinilyticus]|uniref:Phospholipid/glycerol acyltransferase domain-containing protein n=1 Tax=Aneurinibacillus aneurinilyticus TaxID=1391 RepID=A0A848D0S1_ANEAE|nr:1-acyl-sn-glycerol-3-phosphate acyltransferase [Aneurinibacillus aneurinilyticus]NME99426.1 hypothetical protein [Aneurinibacillus aneurinilyticus]